MLALAAGPTAAHHSSAPFDEKAEIQLDGSVVKFEWANPHAYVFLRVAAPGGNEATWEIEAPPIALLRRVGWSKDSLSAGDHVVIKAHPPKDPSRAAALFISAQKADGTILSMADFDKAVADTGPALTGTHVGLQGTWATLLSETAKKLFEDDSALKNSDLWPLTPAGAYRRARGNT